MKLDFSMINWDLVLQALKWGAMIGAVLYVVHSIKEAGRNEEQLVNAKADLKVVEQKIEVKDEVHKVINRVVIDPDYRERVRSQYDTSGK